MSLPLGGEVPASARRGSLELILEWDRRKSTFMDELVREHLDTHSLEARDRGFLVELSYGAVRHRNTLRHISERFCHGSLGKYHRAQRAALALGIYQCVYLGTPDHAVVDTTVSTWRELMAETWGPSKLNEGAGFLNAILRRFCSSVEHFGVDERDPRDVECVRTRTGWARITGLGLPPWELHRSRHLGLKYSHPEEMVRIWSDRFDDDTLVQVLAHDNVPPPLFVIVRESANLELFRRKLKAAGIESHGTEEPRTLRLESAGDVRNLPGYETGEFWVQDITARKIALTLPHRPGATLLDLCAAPGGKLMSIMDRTSLKSVLACDVSAAKLSLLAHGLERLQLDVSKIQVLEAPDDPARLRVDRRFDQIIVDAPCSNTGVLARRHEARWRYVPETLKGLQRTQLALLRAAVDHLATGGDLLYTTCSIEPLENSEVTHTILRTSPHLRLVEERDYLPGDGPDGGDGGYAALFRRP